MRPLAMNKKILIVEDEGIVSLEIRETLENLGYMVVGEAQSGEQAVDMAREHHPDLVLMDIVIQGDMDGIDTAERIYSLFGIPVIYLTSHSDDATLKRALKTNAFGYLIKPFNDRELYSNIEMTLHKHRIMKKVEEPSEIIDSTLTLVSDAVITTDTKGGITRINPPAETLTGWSGVEAAGSDLFTLLGLEREKISAFMESVRNDSYEKKALLSWADGLRLRTKAGKEISISLNIGYIRGNKWNHDEYFFVLIPDEVQKESREGILERYYRIILDAIKDPVFLTDSGLKIIVYNEAFLNLCTFMGVSLTQLGEPLYDILPPDIFGSRWDYEELFKTPVLFNRERSFKGESGTRFFDIETIPLSDGNIVTHVAVVVFDITQQKERDWRDEMIEKNFRAHSKNVEEIADLCALLKPPIGRIRRIAESSVSPDNKKILGATTEISDIIFKIDMKWLKYEKIKSYFDVRNGPLPEEEKEEDKE